MRQTLLGALLLVIGLGLGLCSAALLWTRPRLPSGHTPHDDGRACPAVALFSVQELREHVFEARGNASQLVRTSHGVDIELLRLVPDWHEHAPGLRVRCYTDVGYVELGVSRTDDASNPLLPADRRPLAATKSSVSSEEYLLWYRVRELP